MRSKTQIIHEFLERLDGGIDTIDELFSELGVIRDQVFTGSVLEEIQHHYETLASQALASVPNHQLGHLSLFLGMGVESGIPPECLGDPLIPRASEMLVPLAECLSPLLAREQSSDDEPDEPCHPVDFLAEHHPDKCSWWDALEGCATALTSVALLSHAMRLKMRARHDLMDAISTLAHFNDAPGWTYDMVNMLSHEEILIIHVPSRRGWTARANGVYNNFQLYALTLGALQDSDSGEDLLDEPLPQEHLLAYKRFGLGAVGSLTSTLGFYTCQALDDALQIAKPHAHKIYNEGKPWQVPRHGGQFVVLLSDSPITRSWTAGADTDLIDSTIQIKDELAPAEVERLLEAMRREVVVSIH